MNYSKNKEIIYRIIKDNPVHLNVDEIFDLVKQENPKLGIATVYRNVNNLVDEKRIIRIVVPYGKDCFDAVMEKHQHLQCTICGNVDDIDLDVDIKIPNDLGIIDYEVTFYNVCDNCKKE